MTLSINSIVDFFNKHSKKFIIGVIILTGVTLVATGVLWYYRDDLKPAEKKSDYIFEGISSFNGVIKEVSSDSVTVTNRLKNEDVKLKVNEDTIYTKGESLTRITFDEFKKDDQVAVRYKTDSKIIESIWKDAPNE